MKIKDMEGLFIHQLKDLYAAEKHILKALPKMAKAANHDDLRRAFEEDERVTEKQMERLESMFERMDVSARGAKCPAIEGILEEADELLHDEIEPHVLDAGLICAAQRVEHYEIAGYGCVRTLAQQLGKEDIGKELQATLDEEKQANQKLNEIAVSHVNQEAVAAGHGESWK